MISLLQKVNEPNTRLEKDKSVFNRENIVSDMLKRVIIRVDFSRVLNFDSFVEVAWKNGLFASFSDYEKREGNGRACINDNHSSSPIEEKVDTTIHHFYGQLCETCPSVSLDITDNAFVLVVEVNEYYDGSRSYSNFISDLCYQAYQHDNMIRIRRIGVRKFDEKEVAIKTNRLKFFSPNLHILDGILPQTDGNTTRAREMAEVAIYNGIQNNFHQRVDVSNDGTKCRVRFDMDAFCEDSKRINVALQSGDTNAIFSLIYHDIQDHMFEKYKEWVSFEYLRNHVRK